MTICDDCGEEREARDPYATPPGVTPYRVCRDCYEATPEPDTGRPDWEDLA